MSYTNGLDKPSDYFNTKLYTGTGSELSISSLDFSPDWVWVKQRGADASHFLYDSVRGATKSIRSNSTNAEATVAQSLKSFDSNGFTLGTSAEPNTSSGTYVGWNWKANGAGSANTDGSINSTVSANTTSGFSIVNYTGTGSNATIGHGLGAVPKMFIARNITDAEQWTTYHVGLDATAPQNYHVRLNTNDARIDEAAVWNDTAPTSSVFSVGSSGAPNGNGDNHIAYCFADVQGYSKFGSYTGNGNSDGPMIVTGMKPAWLMIKKSSATEEWYMYDNKRTPFNEIAKGLAANLSGAEFDTGATIDFLSNGFKNTGTNTGTNASGATYIYMAFAENPFVTSTGVPATAR